MKPTDRNNARGFTLMEVIVAIGILSVSAVLLMESHFASLDLTVDAQDVATVNRLLALAVNYAEVQVAAGEENGGGDFGEAYPGYAYSFDANEVDDEDRSGLYDLTVQLATPLEDVERKLFVYVDALALEN